MTTIGRLVSYKIEFMWDDINWYDETNYFISARGSFKSTPPGQSIMASGGIVNRMQVVMNNINGRFGPEPTSLGGVDLTGGKIYNKRVRFSVQIFSGGFVPIFYGIIKIPVCTTGTPKDGPKATFECRTMEDILLQYQTSSPQYRFADNFSATVDESENIRRILTDIGIDTGDMEFETGMLKIPAVWLDNESVLEEIWKIAAACGGRFYANEYGKFVYENMTSWLFNGVGDKHYYPNGTIDRSLYQSISVNYDDSNLYNDVRVEISPREFGQYGILWEPDEKLVVPANGSLTVTARFRQPAYYVTSITYQAITTAGRNISGSITIDGWDTPDAQSVTLTFNNTNTLYAAHLEKLRIYGTPIVGSPTIEERRSSTTDFWNYRLPRVRALRSNLFIQTRAQAGSLAQFLLDTSLLPNFRVNITGLIGDPDLHIGDKVQITDSGYTTGAGHVDAFVTGIDWKADDKGFTQNVELIGYDSVFQYQKNEYLILDDSTYALLSNNQRVFY